MAKLASTRVYGNLIVDNTLSVGATTLVTNLNADLLDGLHLNSTTRNNEANKVVRTDASGYANFGWINTTSGHTDSDVTDVYVNTNDGYIRKKTLAKFKAELGSMPSTAHYHDTLYLGGAPGSNYLKLSSGNELELYNSSNAVISLHLNHSSTDMNSLLGPAGNVIWHAGNLTYSNLPGTKPPSNAQKNSDITKAEIEAKLTGTVGTHNHNYLAQDNLQADLGSHKLSWQQYGNATSPDGGSWHHALRMQHGGYPVNGYYRELLMPFHSNSLYISHVANGAKTITKLATEDWVTSKIPSTSGAYELTKDKIETALKGASTDSIQLGQGSSAGPSSAVLGAHASATGDGSIAIGIATTATGATSTVMGAGSSAKQESTALGANTYAGGSNSTALGCYASAGASNNTIQLGDASGLSTLRSRVNLSVTSDIRDKTDIAEIPKALDFIKDLNPITYVSNDREHYISDEQKETDTYKDYLMVEDYDRESHSQGTKKGSRRRVGLSAQEVRDKLIEHYGSNNYANVVNDNFVEFEERELDVPKDLENKLTMSYETMVPFLIKAIQEQQEQIEELKEKINKG